MKIVTVQFNYLNRQDYGLLLDVFKHSCKAHAPDIEFVEIRIPAPVNNTDRDLNFKYNSVKLRHWVEELEKSKVPVIFADCDMLMHNPPHSAFDIDFDVAYTARTVTPRIPMNGGIMFARPTEGALRFFREMLEANDKMFNDKRFHHQWRRRYAGMNQSAFGYTYECGKHGAKVHKFLTNKWNSVDCDWQTVRNDAVFIHYKSKLRKLILSALPPHGKWKRVMQIWREAKRRMDDEYKRDIKKTCFISARET